MITVLFYCTARSGCEERLRNLVVEMTRVSRIEDEAVSYTFHQRVDKPAEWALYEQWSGQAALDAHVVNMKRHFGNPPAGARLPERLHELVESFSAVFYRVVE